MSRGDVLLGAVRAFYTDAERLRRLTLYTAKDSPVSLRLLDWLVTNYAKKNNVVYIVHRGAAAAPTTFNMFMEYKAQLKAYSKKFFDPFCRRNRVAITNAHGQEQSTTIAQLNFFKWALCNNVIEYALSHKDTIELDMLTVSRTRKQHEQTPDASKAAGASSGASTSSAASSTPAASASGKKRRELSNAAIKSCTKTLCHITVRF